MNITVEGNTGQKDTPITYVSTPQLPLEYFYEFDNSIFSIEFDCPYCRVHTTINRDLDSLYPGYHYYDMVCTTCKRQHWVDWKMGQLHLGLDIGLSEPEWMKSIKRNL